MYITCIQLFELNNICVNAKLFQFLPSEMLAAFFFYNSECHLIHVSHK